MASPGGHFSFAPPQHDANYQPMSNQSPNHRHDNRSVSPSSAKNKFWPFNRSRSSSPNDQALATNARSRNVSGQRSPVRGTSPNNGGGFVVRTVTRQPGGVSAPTSPASDASYRPDWSRAAQPCPRRMTLEDSDEDRPPVVANGQHQLQYKRSKSRPIPSAISLSVPAGGPGGGVGYGTATSSNDGRPERLYSPPQMPAVQRPSSPGGASMTAGGFQKSLQDRGRSPRKAPSGQSLDKQQQPAAGYQKERSRSRSVHSAAESGNVVTPSGKVIRLMITPGPKSLSQQSGGPDAADASSRPVLAVKTSFQSIRPQSIAGPRQFSGSGRPSFDSSAQQQPPPPPPHPDYETYAHSSAQAHRQARPLGFRHSPGSCAVTSATSHVHANGRSSPMQGPASPSQFAAAAAVGAAAEQGQEAGSQGRSRKFSFGFTRGRRASDAAARNPASVTNAAAALLDGVPSPVDIPYGRRLGFGSRSRSRDPGADTDYSYENGASPFGSVSPAGSPGFLASLATARAGDAGGDGPGKFRSASPGGSGLAGKWFKGIFGRSPRAEESDQDWRGAPAYPDVDAASRGREGSPLPALPPHVQPNVQGERQALALRQPPNQERRSQTLPNLPSEDDVEALLQKRQSMKQARRIVDAERRELMSPTTVQKTFDPDQDRELRPKQAVDPSEDYEANLALERRKCPPGRKPVPRLASGSQEDSLSRLEGRLTPAQRIIEETRSMHLARESLEGAKGSPRINVVDAAALANGSRLSNGGRQIQRGFPMSAARNGGGSTVPQQPQPQLEQPETAVRRSGAAGNAKSRSKSKGKGKARDETSSSGAPPPATPAQQMPPLAPVSRSQPAEPAEPPHQQPSRPTAAPAPKAGGALSPGAGPMPLEMTLPQALQEMMVRFYRFERYSVPLIRSLETRLLDIERDAMMASNPQSGGRGNVETASQHEEMDRWVGQMTMLMKHEVGQLKAAAREIREGRELVAQVAKGLGSSSGASIGGSPSLPTFSNIGTPPAGEVAAATSTPSRPLQVEAKGVTDSPSSTKGDTGIQPAPSAAKKQPSSNSATRLTTGPERASDAATASTRSTRKDDHEPKSRRTNVSSSSFRSTIPLTPSKVSAAAPVAPATATAGVGAVASLVLPPGSKPALDKDEGKYGSPTKATFGFNATSEHSSADRTSDARDRSTSPSGRPRFTSALGQPMQNGRLSPGATSPVRTYPDPEVRAGIASPGRWAEDQRRFGQALVASPAISDQASIHRGLSGQSEADRDRPKREVSVEDRLKALMDGRNIRSRASSFAESLAGDNSHEQPAGDGSDPAEGGPPTRIGDNYSPAPEGEPVEPLHATRPFDLGSRRQQEPDEEETVYDRRRQNASQSTTATTSTGAHTITPGLLTGVRPRSPAAVEALPPRPPVAKRNTGEIAKRASAYLEASKGNTPQKSSRDASSIGDSVSPAEFPPSSAPGSTSPSPSQSPAAAIARELSLPPAVAANSTSSDASPTASSASVRQRTMSYLSSAGGACGAPDEAALSDSCTLSKIPMPARSPSAEDEALPETPNKALSPASWLASSSPNKIRSHNASSSSSAALFGTGSHSGRISPSKLHVNRFTSPDKDSRAAGGSSGPLASPLKKVVGLPAKATIGGADAGSTMGGMSKWSATARKEGSSASSTHSTSGAGVSGLGVVKKKRSFAGAGATPPALATEMGIGMGTGTGGTGVGASKSPAMVGHAATLKERVAFFDKVK